MAKKLKLIGMCQSCHAIAMHLRVGAKTKWKEFQITRFCKHCRDKEGENGKKGRFKLKFKIHKGKSN